jgi:hypothetical protein
MPTDLFEATGINPNQPVQNQPRDLFAERGVDPNSSLIDKIINHPITQSIYGAGDALQRALSLGHMKGTAQEVGAANPEGLAYKAGGIGGDVLAAMIPGSMISKVAELGMLGEGATKLAPEALKLASRIGNIGGGMAAGYALNPDNRMMGTAIGGAAGLLPEIGQGLKYALGKVSPGKIADYIKNATSEDALKTIEAPSKSLYNKAFGQSGNTNIYGNISPKNGSISLEDLTSNIPDEQLSGSGIKYSDLDPKQIKSIYSGRDLKLLHNKFVENPTLQNAHDLQSRLGDKVRDLNVKEAVEKSLNTGDQNLLDSYSFARNLLKNDINTFLDTQGPDLSNVYKQAAFEHATNVVPYRNAASMIDAHIGPNESINAKTLARALSRASTEKNLNKTPLPQDIIDAGVELSGRLKNKALSQKIAGGALGAGLAGELIKHTFF